MKETFRKAKPMVIHLTFPKWKTRPDKPIGGYALLVPVPGDLPVFTQIALNIIAGQNSSHLNEILVIPDLPSAAFRRAFNSIRNQNPYAHLTRLIEMKPHHRLIGRLSGSGNMFHFLQLVNGIEASSSSHLIFHDADLFLPPGDFLCERFELCASKNLSVLGINPREKRYTEECRHLVATWEMVARREWIYRFKPYQLRGMQKVTVNGKPLTFDTTHLMQYLSDSKEIHYENISKDFIHFNYVITTYRRFLKAPKPYDDRWFKLLLIRLLIDSSESVGWKYAKLPSLGDFAAALDGKNSKVSCVSAESRSYYPDFRAKLEHLLNLGCFGKNIIDRMRDKIQTFDRHFNWAL